MSILPLPLPEPGEGEVIQHIQNAEVLLRLLGKAEGRTEMLLMAQVETNLALVKALGHATDRVDLSAVATNTGRMPEFVRSVCVTSRVPPEAALSVFRRMASTDPLWFQKKIQVIKEIRAVSSCSLKEAKDIADAALSGDLTWV